MATDPLPYYLGCPVWACDDWVGKIYASKNRRTWLPSYSKLFKTVEGNSTFYGIPSLDTVRRWADETAPGFKFVLKFPRVITHDCQLKGAHSETRDFLRLLDVLAKADRLGPTFLQMSPSFAGKQIDDLAKYLAALPRSFPFAVEVRNFDYFDNAGREKQLVDLLTALGMDWVIFDSRALYSKHASDEFEKESQRRKPQTPVRKTTTGNYPIVRLIGRNKIAEAKTQMHEWVDQVAAWIGEGLRPYLFTHCPDDAFAPEFAFAFHQKLRTLIPTLPELQMPNFPQPERQGRLF